MTKKGLSSVRMVTLYNYGIILYDMILVLNVQIKFYRTMITSHDVYVYLGISDVCLKPV